MAHRLAVGGLRMRRPRRGALGVCLLAGAALCLCRGAGLLSAPLGETPARAFSGGKDRSIVLDDSSSHEYEKPRKAAPPPPPPEVHTVDLGAALSAVVTENAGLLAVITALLCAYLAEEEPPRAPPASVPIEKRPDYGQVCVMTALLCGLSGMVNAVAIIQMVGTVAHQTGNMSHFGRLLGTDGLRFGALLLSFTLGAGVGGFRKADGEALFQGRYCPCLMSSAVATAAGALLQWVSGRGIWVTLPLWAFAQGLQNIVTSRFSSMPLRTTHHTGTLTDMGAGAGLWLRARWGGEAAPSLRKPALLLICFLSYVGGGVAAKAATDAWGILAALPAAAAMAVLALGWVPIAAAPKSKC